MLHESKYVVVFVPCQCPHCKEPVPKIGNIYYQTRNCAVTVPISNFHIHVSVSELYIPTIDLPILVQKICGPILGIYKSLTDTCDMNVEIAAEAVQFPEKEYINGT
jgi:hypothetical protein